jgi:DNA adenine methylase
VARLGRPILRYHGGKWLLAPWIISHFPPHRIYVEPYGGAASVLLRKPRCYSEVWNDLDQEVVNVFRVMRDPEMAAQLEKMLRLTPFSRHEFDQCYEAASSPVERARRTIIRSFMGFTSACTANYRTGFRAHSHRSCTTPAHDWVNFPDFIKGFTARLSGVVLECRPALSILQQHDSPETLYYADPPYPRNTRYLKDRPSLNCYAHEMSQDDHREMAEALKAVEGMVIVSGYRCGLYDELFAGWRREDRAALADGARKRTESLWLSPNCGVNRPLLAGMQA